MDSSFTLPRLATWGRILISVIMLGEGMLTPPGNILEASGLWAKPVGNESTSLASPTSSRSDLTGFWTADDGATYYVLQDANNVVWWVGFSSDGGRSFTNVYRGIWQPNPATEEPADVGTVNGEWADVPLGESLGHGTLRLSLKSSGQLMKVKDTGGFSASTWTKTTTDRVPEPPQAIKKTFTAQSNLTGIWSRECGRGGNIYVHQEGNTVWGFGLAFQEGGPTLGQVFRATLQGNNVSGVVATFPWPSTTGSWTSNLNLEGDRGPASRTLSAQMCTWRKLS